MYYPLLRARQFELIALRELALENVSQGFIIPVIEPVKKSINNLELAYKVFEKQTQQVYLIMNPICGDLKNDKLKMLDFISTKDRNIIRPAFYYNNNSRYIQESINDFNLENVLLICQGDTSEEDVNFLATINLAEITAVSVANVNIGRSLDRFLRGIGKDYIRLDDHFEKQPRNKEFLSIPEHKFSEEHLYYDTEGFSGFSDYTVLPSEFTEGGSTPLAVVIHISYLKTNNQIWIRHFTSDSNDSTANVQGKFAEAATKAVIYCRRNSLYNSATLELMSYYDREHYPGLGTAKKIAIKNHILVVIEYLKSRV